MNQKIKQLKTLLYLDEQTVAESLLKYTQAKKDHTDLDLQHKMLISYQEEYNQRLKGNSTNVLNAHTLQIYYKFVSNLGVAISEQQQKASSANEIATKLFNEYLKLKQKAEGLEKVVENEIELERQYQQKQEQKQNDEVAGSQWNKKK